MQRIMLGLVTSSLMHSSISQTISLVSLASYKSKLVANSSTRYFTILKVCQHIILPELLSSKRRCNCDEASVNNLRNYLCDSTFTNNLSFFYVSLLKTWVGTTLSLFNCLDYESYKGSQRQLLEQRVAQN